MHTNNATGNGEGVQGTVLNQHQFELLILQLTMNYQPVQQLFEIVNNQGIRGRRHLTAVQSQPLLPQFALLYRGNQAGASIAQHGEFYLRSSVDREASRENHWN